MNKKIMMSILSLLVILIIPISSVASSEVRIWVDGNFVNSDVSPYIDMNRTMVPIRVISENLNKEVIWNNESRTIEINEKSEDRISKSILLQIDKKTVSIKKDGAEIDEIILDHAPEIKNDRTYVPLRNVAELFDKNVSWDSENRVAVVGDGYKSKEKTQLTTKDFLPYMYNEEMLNKGVDEQLDYEKVMGESESKYFPGYTNKDVEVAVAWLSYDKAGLFEIFQKQDEKRDALELLLGKNLGYGFTNKGEVLSIRTTENDLTYPRRFTDVFNDDSMASMVHFDYYPNFDGTINTFLFPLHDHFATREEAVETYEKIFNNPKNVKLGEFTKEEIQPILNRVEIIP